MSKPSLSLLLFLSLAMGTLQAADASGPAPPQPAPSDKRVEFIKKFDRNGDGKLDQQEREAARQAHQAELLKRYDQNGNGKIDQAERDAAREEFRRGRDSKEPESPKPEQKAPPPEKEL